MTKSEVLSLLKEQRDERGVANWKKRESGTGGLKSYGIGLTKLRKLSRQIGRDHDLAAKLWACDNHDAKVVGLLIDEPKKLTRKQVEEQVEGVGVGMLAHVFSSCDATLPKASFAPDLARDWIGSDCPMRRSCGYGLMYELSKNKRNKELTDKYFLDCIGRIRTKADSADHRERLSMGGALIGIGKRNRKLNRESIKVAKAMGPVHYATTTSDCESLDILKHLTSDYLKEKLNA